MASRNAEELHVFFSCFGSKSHMAKTLNSRRLLSSRGAGSAEPLEVKKRQTFQVLAEGEMTQGKKMEDVPPKARSAGKKKMAC